MPNPPPPGLASNLMPAELFAGPNPRLSLRQKPVESHSELVEEIRKLREAIERQEARALWNEFERLTARWRVR